jgi:hypothetical protein
MLNTLGLRRFKPDAVCGGLGAFERTPAFPMEPECASVRFIMGQNA